LILTGFNTISKANSHGIQSLHGLHKWNQCRRVSFWQYWIRKKTLTLMFFSSWLIY